MKSDEKQLWRYDVVYMPKYLKKNSVRPSLKLNDVVEIMDSVNMFLKGGFTRWNKNKWIYTITRYNKYFSRGLAVEFKNSMTNHPDIVFHSVWYDHDKDANPYSLKIRETVSILEDTDTSLEILKALAGHYAYSYYQLENYGYYLEKDEKNKDKKNKLSHIIKELRGGRGEICYTKYDKVNEFLYSFEPGTALTRNEQVKMLQTLANRFNICVVNKDVYKRPFTHLGAALKYTDFKITTAGVSEMDKYYGLRIFVPKDENEKINYLDTVCRKIKETVKKINIENF